MRYKRYIRTESAHNKEYETKKFFTRRGGSRCFGRRGKSARRAVSYSAHRDDRLLRNRFISIDVLFLCVYRHALFRGNRFLPFQTRGGKARAGAFRRIGGKIVYAFFFGGRCGGCRRRCVVSADFSRRTRGKAVGRLFFSCAGIASRVHRFRFLRRFSGRGQYVSHGDFRGVRADGENFVRRAFLRDFQSER